MFSQTALHKQLRQLRKNTFVTNIILVHLYTVKQTCNFFLLFIIICLTCNTFAQAVYVKPNELNLISFNTANGKRVAVVIDTINRYIAYRYGTNDHIELTYPKNPAESYQLFRWFYSFTDVDYGQCYNLSYYSITFINGNYSYKVYKIGVDDNASNPYNFNYEELGVTVINNITNQEFKIKGIPYTDKGNLYPLFTIKGLKRSSDAF